MLVRMRVGSFKGKKEEMTGDGAAEQAGDEGGQQLHGNDKVSEPVLSKQHLTTGVRAGDA